MPTRHWTDEEVREAVASYIAMLDAYHTGDRLVKIEHIRALMSRIDNRTRPAVEMKFRNISAVLAEAGLDYLDGYLPAFNYQIWAWHVAVPLELGLVLAMMYFREGGYSIGAVTGLTLICIFAACCGVAPIYSGITWVGQQLGLSLSVMGDLEIYSWDAALAHTGTYVRASLLFSSVAAIPAVIILRLVAFERVRLRKAVTASPPAPPEDPAA